VSAGFLIIADVPGVLYQCHGSVDLPDAAGCPCGNPAELLHNDLSNLCAKGWHPDTGFAVLSIKVRIYKQLFPAGDMTLCCPSPDFVEISYLHGVRTVESVTIFSGSAEIPVASTGKPVWL
jgi:hypothetical protein